MHWDHSTVISRTVSILLAEDELPSQAFSPAAAAVLDSTYGITNPDLLAHLLPTARATYQALRGLPHDKHIVDPLVHRQIRHTLALDTEDLSRRGHITWELDGDHRAATRG
ncbi:hypothetical protein KILIM_044_00380 [Kineosphaera limosa NBRC 100340]|uniref:Uncharacterized protein n=1 Tax=Kineosphaera limosa NBRC 100340 TaxID=1184609 RepID=K6XCV7_9MICO|nr:hypothetical protein KILIM_044_00380 [Kineosphaera limosa NBRC 100340]